MKEIGVDIKIANADPAVLRRVAAQGQLRHRQLRLGRHPVRHLRQPGHLPDRRRRQLRLLREQEGRRPVRAGEARLRRRQGGRAGQPDRPAAHRRHGEIPLYNRPTLIAWRNTFTNIPDNATNEGPFWNANTWGRTTAYGRRAGNALDAGRWDAADRVGSSSPPAADLHPPVLPRSVPVFPHVANSGDPPARPSWLGAVIGSWGGVVGEADQKFCVEVLANGF